MELTNHALRRKGQRGLSDFSLGIIEQYGRHERAPGGAIKVFFGKREYQRAVAEFKRAIQLLDKAKGGTLVLRSSGIHAARKVLGAKWSWIRLDWDDYKTLTTNKCKESDASISEQSIELANLLTRFSDVGSYKHLSFPEQDTLRLLLIIGFFFRDVPFEVSISPVTIPLEIAIRESVQRQAYSRVLAITEEESYVVHLAVESEHFTPLLSNFMILP